MTCGVVTWEDLEVTENCIELKPGTKRAHQIPYRQGLQMREKTVEDVGNQLEKGVIELASSEWASSFFFVLKSDGSLLFCVE